MRLIGSSYDRDLEKIFKDYLPSLYSESKVVSEIIKVDSMEMEELYTAANDLYNQLFIEQSTWILDKWEEVLNIETDLTKTFEQRRSVIMARLRGYGVVNAELIKNVAESFLNGECEVTEYNKNLLPPFTDSGWMDQASGNFTVLQPYRLQMIAGGVERKLAYRINAIPNQTYTISGVDTGNANVTYNVVYEGNGFAYLGEAGNKQSITFTTPSTCKTLLIRMIIRSSVASGTFIFENPQLELGSVATDFEKKGNYEIGVILTGTRGIPDDMDSLQEAIRNITPAHLVLSIIITYLVFLELDTQNWSIIDTYKWEALEVTSF